MFSKQSLYRMFFSLALSSAGLLFCDEDTSTQTLITASISTSVNQLNKALAKSFTEKLNLTEPLVQVITQAELTLILSDVTKDCVRSFFPRSIAKAYELGGKGSLALDLHKAVREAQKAFPVIQRPLLEAPSPVQQPFIFKHPTYGIPSSSSAPAIIEPFDYELATILNYGFLHAVVGFSTAILSRILTGRALASAAPHYQQELEYKVVSTAATILLADWFNQGVQALLEHSPENSAEETRFYQKMCSIGTRLFSTVDKVFGTSAVLQTTEQPFLGALAALFGVAHLKRSRNEIKPFLDTLAHFIHYHDYEEVHNVVNNNIDLIKQLSPQQKKYLQDLLYAAENAVLEDPDMSPEKRHDALQILINVWNTLDYT